MVLHLGGERRDILGRDEGVVGAVHSFTHKAAGNDNSKGAAYNADADRDSWHQMEQFLKRLF